MSKRCCAKMCFNSSLTNKSVAYFAFPKEQTYATSWALAADRPDLLEKSLKKLIKYFLCSEHFTDDCFIDPPHNRKLRKTSRPVHVPLPTIFRSNMLVQNMAKDSVKPIAHKGKLSQDYPIEIDGISCDESYVDGLIEFVDNPTEQEYTTGTKQHIVALDSEKNTQSLVGKKVEIIFKLSPTNRKSKIVESSNTGRNNKHFTKLNDSFDSTEDDDHQLSSKENSNGDYNSNLENVRIRDGDVCDSFSDIESSIQDSYSSDIIQQQTSSMENILNTSVADEPDTIEANMIDEDHFEIVEQTVNINEICRLCAERITNGQFVKLFSNESMAFTACIQELLPDTIHQEDQLPHQVCLKCVNLATLCLDTIHSFHSAQNLFKLA